MQQTVTDEFKRFGIGVLNFYIESIHVVEDDLKSCVAFWKAKPNLKCLEMRDIPASELLTLWKKRLKIPAAVQISLELA